MDGTFKIGYSFQFESGEVRNFTLSLDRGDLSLRPAGRDDLPPWAALANHRCGNCSLDDSVAHCPIAVNLLDLVETFRDSLSYEQTVVTVTTDERAYVKTTTLQEGLSGISGIIMATSGCPVMARLKPMVRFHLPFATLEETTFRMASLFLVAQYCRRRHGLPDDQSLSGLEAIYAEVTEVNKCFAKRLREATHKDASINALVNLHCFAEMVPFAAEEMLQEIEPYFAAYLA